MEESQENTPVHSAEEPAETETMPTSDKPPCSKNGQTDESQNLKHVPPGKDPVSEVGDDKTENVKEKNMEDKTEVESDQTTVSSVLEMDSAKNESDETPAEAQVKRASAGTGNGQQMTGYLQHVISCLQSATESQSGIQDQVLISRGELTSLVQQTLTAQTMCNYMQQLVQENKSHKQEKQMLLGLVLQARQQQSRMTEEAAGGGQAEVTQGQLADGRVFRFDKCSLPFSSSQELITKDSGIDSKTGEDSRRDTDMSSIASQLMQDGDSMSFQLPSNLGLDGDPASDVQTGTGEKGASGNIPHQLLASPFGGEAAPICPGMNIPTAALLEGAEYHSFYLLQVPEAAGVSGAVVSKEEHELVLEELEKTKRHLHRLFKDGGIHPDTAVELTGLKTKLSSLQTENIRLLRELESRPTQETLMKQLRVPLEEKAVRERIQRLEKNAQMKDDVINTLNMKIKHLEQEQTKELPRHGAQSQPPSNVGLTALPHIRALSQVACQTDHLGQLRTAETQTQGLSEVTGVRQLQRLLEQAKSEKTVLERETNKLRQQLIQARENEMELGKSKEKMLAQNNDLKQQLHEANEHRKELAEEIIAMNNELDEQKRKARDLDQNRQALERIIADERKRYSRDEKELLQRLDSVGRERYDAVQLLVAADDLWRKGAQYCNGVPVDYSKHITNFRRQFNLPPHEHVPSSGAQNPGPASRPNIPVSSDQGMGHGSHISSSQASSSRGHVPSGHAGYVPSTQSSSHRGQHGDTSGQQGYLSRAAPTGSSSREGTSRTQGQNQHFINQPGYVSSSNRSGGSAGNISAIRQNQVSSHGQPYVSQSSSLPYMPQHRNAVNHLPGSPHLQQQQPHSRNVHGVSGSSSSSSPSSSSRVSRQHPR